MILTYLYYMYIYTYIYIYSIIIYYIYIIHYNIYIGNVQLVPVEAKLSQRWALQIQNVVRHVKNCTACMYIYIYIYT